MNSPFVLARAKAFAARPDVAGLADEAKLDRMHELAYGRRADAEERALGLTFVRDAGWETYAQVLLLGNEFAFVD
jgi:hypothetical protein